MFKPLSEKTVDDDTSSKDTIVNPNDQYPLLGMGLLHYPPPIDVTPYCQIIAVNEISPIASLAKLD